MNARPVIDHERAPFTLLVDDVLTSGECEELIARIDGLSPAVAPITTHRGFELRPDIRNNERVVFDDVGLAGALFDRLRPVVPAELRERDGLLLGRAVGLNERFRGYRYSEGHRFAPHFDGAFARNARECSELTVLLYLNEGFLGGATAFCDWEARVVPRRGQALLFQHAIRHEGCPVDGGRKYVLRTDVMYQRDS
jgi:prolyl 4-hydroxylase